MEEKIEEVERDYIEFRKEMEEEENEESKNQHKKTREWKKFVN